MKVLIDSCHACEGNHYRQERVQGNACTDACGCEVTGRQQWNRQQGWDVCIAAASASTVN